MRKDNRWENVIAVAVSLVIVQATLLLFPARAAAEIGILLPYATAFDGACNGVECGLGRCRVSPDRAFGYVCDCEPGWTQFRVNQVHDPFRFLPCIIPNCTFNYACYNESMHEPVPSIPITLNFSLFDPCFWSYCGSGNCVRTSGFKHRCECKKGYDNILNITSLPCVKNCEVAADCIGLGFPLSNGTFPPTPTNFFRNDGQVSSSPSNWLLLFLTITMVLVT